MRNLLKIIAMLAFTASLIPATWPAAPATFISIMIYLLSTTFDEAERALRELDKTERELIRVRHEKRRAELKLQERILINERVRESIEDAERALKWVKESRAKDAARKEAEANTLLGFDESEISEDIEAKDQSDSPFGELVKL